VISTRERDSAVLVEKVRVRFEMTSVPELVLKVKVSEVVAVPPGEAVLEAVSVPFPKVTTNVFGIICKDVPRLQFLFVSLEKTLNVYSVLFERPVLVHVTETPCAAVEEHATVVVLIVVLVA
jgi:hypothetical protein